MKKDFVYHASKTQNLKFLSPTSSTHKKPYVYATKDIATSALFLGYFSDFICQVDIDENNRPFIFEWFHGALDIAFENTTGSIYKLAGLNFKSGKTSWAAEVVSEFEEEVLEEIKVDNTLGFLDELVKEDRLKIYRYPEKPYSMANSKSGLIDRAVNWTIDFGEHTLDEVLQYHPDILGKVLEELKQKHFEFKDKNFQKILQAKMKDLDKSTSLKVKRLNALKKHKFSSSEWKSGLELQNEVR